jgi:hypothetical protein
MGMNRRSAPVLLSPALAGVVLAGFALSGLMIGILTHGVVASLSAGAQSTVPGARRTPTAVQPTPTSTPTVAVPDTPFALQLTVTPTHVRVGDTVSLEVVATFRGTASPVAELLCTLRAPEGGPAPLLASWPAPATTDAQGRASWQIVVPQLPAGRYGVEVSASGAHSYRTWRIVSIYVEG